MRKIETKILKVTPSNPEIHVIKIAAEIIKEGGTVAFPTETVYGLGANALDSDAVMKIFIAKNRPADNPLIVHVSSKEEIHFLVEELPEKVELLIENFWPGPLTLILKKSKIVPNETTAGLNTVAIRMPKHEVALALIEQAGVPIAAPSANLAGKPSPTLAEHVKKDLYGRIDAIIDAGPTNIGVESTVIDMTSAVPMLLRPGGITLEQLKNILGKVELHPTVLSEKSLLVEKIPSPGMKHRHYAPNAKLIIIEGKKMEKIMNKVQEIAHEYMKEGKKVGILANNESKFMYNADVIKSAGNRNDFTEIARNLFRLLREFDEENVDVVIAEGISLKGIGLAIMNRLRKAASYNIINVD
ncbi:MAG: L-threonylcarbamoyladenylate synthase [Promethearchaeota archaeon]